MEILSTPIIMVLICAIIEILKITFKKYTAFINFIPLIGGVLGIGFGLMAFYLMPQMTLAKDVLDAIIIGLFSGLSAVGSISMVKDLKTLVNIKKQTSLSNSDNSTNTEAQLNENATANKTINTDTTNTTSEPLDIENKSQKLSKKDTEKQP